MVTKVYQDVKPGRIEDSSPLCISCSHPQFFLGVVPWGHKPWQMGNVGTGILLELTLTQSPLWKELPALCF